MAEQYKPTLTLTELYQDLRRCGIKTSTTKIKALIQQGKYSDFAVSCELSNTAFEIYRKPYEEWKLKNGLRYIN
jgi:hypothetical protein